MLEGCEGVLRLPRVLILRCEGEARASKERTRGSLRIRAGASKERTWGSLRTRARASKDEVAYYATARKWGEG
jgi:hypothetical protein